MWSRARYGYNALPAAWLANLNRWDQGEIALRGVPRWLEVAVV